MYDPDSLVFALAQRCYCGTISSNYETISTIHTFRLALYIQVQNLFFSVQFSEDAQKSLQHHKHRSKNNKKKRR